jgi:hypothetical protein
MNKFDYTYSPKRERQEKRREEIINWAFVVIMGLALGGSIFLSLI